MLAVRVVPVAIVGVDVAGALAAVGTYECLSFMPMGVLMGELTCGSFRTRFMIGDLGRYIVRAVVG